MIFLFTNHQQFKTIKYRKGNNKMSFLHSNCFGRDFAKQMFDFID